MSRKTNYVKTTDPSRAGVPLALAVLLRVSSGSAQALAEGAPVTAQPGGTVTIYVQPQKLAEAEKPTVELAEGAAFWLPGPERFYGYALRDLRDHLQQMTGARF